MPSYGNVPCYFHPQEVNAGWCVKCGKPICDDCTQSSFWIASGYDVCPPCKSKQMALFSAKFILFFGFISIISVALGGWDAWLPFTISTSFLIPISVIFMLHIRSWRTWAKYLGEYPPLDSNNLTALRNQKIIRCDYHPNALSIQQCDTCHREICIKCLWISRRNRRHPPKILCHAHSWSGRRLAIFSYLGLILILLITALIINFIGFTQFNALGLFLKILFIFILPLLGAFIALWIYYLKVKRDYLDWRDELGIKDHQIDP